MLAWCWGHISIQCSVKLCNTSDLTIWHLSCSDTIWTYNFPRRSFTAMFSSFIWRWKRLSCGTSIMLYSTVVNFNRQIQGLLFSFDCQPPALHWLRHQFHVVFCMFAFLYLQCFFQGIKFDVVFLWQAEEHLVKKVFAGTRQLLWEMLKESRYEFDYLICLNRMNAELNCSCWGPYRPCCLRESLLKRANWGESRRGWGREC